MINRIATIVETTEYELVSVTCDICHKEYKSNDRMELQEFHYINFVGGYGSVFGDGTKIECDICQRCLLELIKGKYHETETE